MTGRTHAPATRALRAFTMIEMLVSLSIFAVITAFMTANFRAGRQSDELRIASSLASTTLRRAQTMAIASQTVFWCTGGTRDQKTCPNGTAAECPGGACAADVPKGYGVHFMTTGATQKQAILYADVNGNRAYDAGEDLRTELLSPGTFVTVSALNPVTAGNALDIDFEPPVPTVWFNGSNATAIATITVQHTTTLRTKSITVNRISGQISNN